MDDPTTGFTKKYTLKVNIHCPECEMRVYKTLKKINGVKSISINGDDGMVIVTGNVDLAKLVMALAKKGKRPEIMQIQDVHPEQPAPPVPTSNSQSQPTVESSAREIHSNHHIVNIGKLKQVELTHSKSLRMRFGTPSNENVMGDSNEPHAHCCFTAAAASCSVASDHGAEMNDTQKHNRHAEVSGNSRAACRGSPHGRNYGDRQSPTCCVPPAPHVHHNHHGAAVSITMTCPCSDHHVLEGPEAPISLAHPCSIFADEHLGRCNLM